MKLTGSLIVVLLLVTGLFFSRCGNDGDVIDTVATPISHIVKTIPVTDEYYGRKMDIKTKVFYRANQYQRGWLKKRRPEKLYKAFVNEVKNSRKYGFVPEDYHIAQLEQAVEKLYDNKKRTKEDISALDIRITASFFLFTTHVLEGRVRYPGAQKFFWEKDMPLENDIALLLKMKSASDLRKELDDLHPKDLQYKKLQTALARYRELEKLDTFPAIPENITLKPGDTSDVVPLIKKKLSLTDYRGKIENTDTVYDGRLVNAVTSFQQRHGLQSDGVIDRPTVRLLNMTVREKADLIALNLERLRWHPRLRAEKDAIVINVPEYMLRVYRNNKEKMNMRVIIGAEFTPTPVFHDTLKYIVFNPTWMVPKSILEKEFLPKLIEDPGHFSSERFRFYKEGKEIDPWNEPWEEKDIDINDYSVVENPGDANSLGKVKFIMPNDFSVYLHDTPADKLFERQNRALSHGCIRLERPEEFAEYLLKGQKEWDEKKIRKAMQGDKPVQVDLETQYPVYIVYRTAWVDDDERVNFRDDIYGHDQRHLTHLSMKYPD